MIFPLFLLSSYKSTLANGLSLDSFDSLIKIFLDQTLGPNPKTFPPNSYLFILPPQQWMSKSLVYIISETIYLPTSLMNCNF